MLEDLETIGFVPAADLDRARAFYEDVLGLRPERDDGFALVFNPGGRMLRVVAAGEFTPQPFTVFGWESPDIAATVAELSGRAVEMLRYPHLEQDADGIWTAPGGDRVAWFRDPDGNVLSISQHVRP